MFESERANAQVPVNLVENCIGTLWVNRKNTKGYNTGEIEKKGETIAEYSQGPVIEKGKDKREVTYIIKKT